MIYTSYFAKYKGDKGVSIARFTPKWFKGYTYIDLAPSIGLLEWWKHSKQTAQDIETYKIWYNTRVLCMLNPHKVASELDGKVLLCYEGPLAFCHRHLVAEWLRDNGYECEELEC